MCKSHLTPKASALMEMSNNNHFSSILKQTYKLFYFPLPRTFRVMQQKAFEESRYPWQESFENVAVCLPFRCPRCGDHTRFRSLSSLRAHLEFSHSYQERTLLTKCSLFPSLKDTDLVTSSEALKTFNPG